jgi:hypothetical protein
VQVPSMVRAWRHSGCMAGLAWERHLRCFSSTGGLSSMQRWRTGDYYEGTRPPEVELGQVAHRRSIPAQLDARLAA